MRRGGLIVSREICACVGVAIFTGTFIAAAARAQEQLPAIVVTTPSPIAKATRTEPAKPARKGAGKTAQPSPSQPAPGEVPAVTATPGLLIVDDSFVPLTVVPEREIVASPGATITDALQSRPGLTGTTFAPGADRPIVRGFDSYRVRTQENGIGTHDVANLSEDHAVPIDPNAAEQIEVVRGPATLRYGSQAIGGVVDVTNSRIPDFVPRQGFIAETRGGLSSVDRSWDSAFKVTAGAGNFAVHADGFKREAEDYDTPAGRQLNSFVNSQGYSVGSSYVGIQGFFGVAYSRFESLYGIPGKDAAGERTRIDLGQDKITSKGEWRVRDYGLEAIRFWLGATDYAHNEIGFESGSADIGSRFTNKEIEGRLEVQHLPVATSLGELRGAVGVQSGAQRLEGRSFEGDSLLDPAHTQSVAGFWFEELALTPALRLQAAVRLEHTTVDGRGLLDPADPLTPTISRERDFTPVSASVGILYDLPFGVVARLNGQYVERAPAAGELFSKGAHDATGTFEIGNINLEKEKARTVELGFRRAKGALRFDASAYYTQFDGFIFKQVTGVRCGGTIDSCGVEDELDQVVFQQRNATFYGAEITTQYDVAKIWHGVWGVEGQYDFVHATFDDGENVPRIPPHRLGGGLYYHDAAWLARLDLLHAFRQDQIGLNETPTSGYNLLNAELSYTTTTNRNGQVQPVMTIGVKGENLLNDDARNSASFKKDEILLPGANVRLFGILRFN
jgi:iron complex outermembrane receptor protein